MKHPISTAPRAPRVIRWSFVIAANAAILVLVGVSTIRETYQGWKVDQEIHGLQAQVEAMEGKRLHLNDLIQKIQAPDTLDKEARMRFGLRKPGERVVVIKGMDGSYTLDVEKQAPLASAADSVRSNPQKWLHYFFQQIN